MERTSAREFFVRPFDLELENAADQSSTRVSGAIEGTQYRFRVDDSEWGLTTVKVDTDLRGAVAVVREESIQLPDGYELRVELYADEPMNGLSWAPGCAISLIKPNRSSLARKALQESGATESDVNLISIPEYAVT